MTETIPHIPITPIPAPSSTDLDDVDNTYPLLQDLTIQDVVGPEAANRQPRALDVRTETIRGVLNQIVDIANALNANLLHRDGTSVGSYMRGELSMTNPTTAVAHRVTNTAVGVAAQDGVIKSQLDTLQTFVDGLQSGLTQYVKRDGSTPMTGNLNLGTHKVSNATSGVADDELITLGYATVQLDALVNGYVNRDGSIGMTGNLDMGGFRITNLDLSALTDDGDGVARSHLITAINTIAAIPTGTILFYAGWITSPPPPDGWLICDGRAVSRTTYSVLFALIGETYGVGNGSSTYNLPDFRGRIAMGLDNMGGTSADVVTDVAADSLGGTMGLETHTLVSGELPAHTHTYDDQYVAGTAGGAFVGPSVTNATSVLDEQVGRVTGSVGGGAAHNNVQPVMAVNVLIKYLVLFFALPFALYL